jgi:hypothetical protein
MKNLDEEINSGICNNGAVVYAACSVGWWLMAGADLF